MRLFSRSIRPALLVLAVTLAVALGFLTAPRTATAVSAAPVAATSATSATLAASRTGESSDEFVIASFNILGASHTDGRRRHRGFDRSWMRLPRAIKVLRRASVDVVGLQEFQRSQRDRFVGRVGKEWAVYSTYTQNTDNSIAWRTDRFSFVEGWSARVPYFHGRMRKMPIVALRSRVTGRVIYVMNVHNPADSHGDASAWRRRATFIERRVTSQLSEERQAPVFLTGDMNDRAEFYCPFTRIGVMQSFLGGSNPEGGPCLPPPAGIDWIFGNRYVEFSEPLIDRSSLVAAATDHPLVAARVRLLP